MKVKDIHLSYDHLSYKSPIQTYPDFTTHSHNMYEILFFEKGEAEFIIESNIYDLKKNNLIFIRPQMFHHIRFKGNAEYSRYVINFDNTIINSKLIDNIPKTLEIINYCDGSIVNDIFKKIDYFSLSLDKEDFLDVLTCLIKEILYALTIYEKDEYMGEQGTSKILSQCLKYINENLFTIKGVDEICKKNFISQQYCFRIFKDVLNTTPKKYINLKRLLYAQNAIRQGHKITEIYQQCGFESYAGFYKQYLKTFGHSPSQELSYSLNDGN